MAITGAARGIGRGVARRLADDGYGVALSDIDSEGVKEVAREIVSLGGVARAERIDVTDREAVATWVDHVDNHFGALTGIVANAGILIPVPFLELTEELWHRTIDVNLHGVFHLVAPVARKMAERRRGSIVIIASAATRSSGALTAHYAASKMALHGLTRSMASELGPLGVRVNAVSPGSVDTDMWQDLAEGYASLSGRTAEEEWEAEVARIPLRRRETPADVAKIVAYLLSDESDYMTGQNISYDGGARMP